MVGLASQLCGKHVLTSVAIQPPPLSPLLAFDWVSKSSVSKATRDSRCREFVEITGATQSEALRFLKAAGYRLEPAMDAFFNDPHASAMTQSNSLGSKSKTPVVSTKSLEKLWEKYQDPSNPNETDGEGTERYCTDLGITMDEIVVFSIAHLTSAPSMPKLAKAGWIEGWKKAGKDTIEGQRSYLTKLRSDLADLDGFRKVYNYTFDYAREEGQKSLQLEIAKALWDVFIPQDPSAKQNPFPPKHLEMWQQFLTDKGGKAVSKDTWNLFLEFTRVIDPQFENHDEEAAWPSLIDDFVEFSKTKNGMNVD